MSRRRCAIYTRKSVEEGLDQAFNSLDAQREACEAYITSQAGTGWACLKARYDDGGLSGATMQRPALQKLLTDIRARRVDIVVVYKVDRLTRALADFAKMVEIFDACDVSFVSVTQQFNTTTSMGRLTLNVLLSFAQFEREVTGERIRDKIAASKKKGMWMGGVVPLGYRAVERNLVIDEAEASTVRTLFDLYLRHGNVRLVKVEADRLKLRTKLRKPNNGERSGGEPFTRGHIYKLLSNPLYVGDIVHKGTQYPGEHAAIISRETWAAVQHRLKLNAVDRKRGANVESPSILSGILFAEGGDPLVPSHTTKAGRRYRYYVSRPPAETSANRMDGWRLPAQPIEDLVCRGVIAFLRNETRLSDALGLLETSPGRLNAMLCEASRLSEILGAASPTELRTFLLDTANRVEVKRDRVTVVLRTRPLRAMLANGRPEALQSGGGTDARDELRLDLPVRFKRRGVETKLVMTDAQIRTPQPDPKLIAAIAQAWHWCAELNAGEVNSVRDLADRYGRDRADVSRMLPLAYLSPEIVEAILDGNQPTELTAARLKRLRSLPLSWSEQRRILGFV